MDRDLPLVRALKWGSRQAFNHIYELYADKVYRVSCRMYLSEEEAQEMVQEVFMTLWEQRSKLKESLSLNAYLLTITRNKIINYQKKRAAGLSRNLSWLHTQTSCYKNTEDQLLFEDMERHTLQFIETLPDRYRQIFILSRRKGLSNDDIASQLQLSKRTVENNIYQAEKAIYQFLQKSKLIIQSLAVVLCQTIF